MTSELSAGAPVFHQSLYCSAPMISDISGVNYFKMLQAGIEPTHLRSEADALPMSHICFFYPKQLFQYLAKKFNVETWTNVEQ